MSTVLNKQTLEIRYSVSTPDYPKDLWWNTFDETMPELPEGFTPGDTRNWKTVNDKIVATTEEEKAKWDAEHPVPEPVPTVEERLATVESDLAIVKSDVSDLKAVKESIK